MQEKTCKQLHDVQCEGMKHELLSLESLTAKIHAATGASGKELEALVRQAAMMLALLANNSAAYEHFKRNS